MATISDGNYLAARPVRSGQGWIYLVFGVWLFVSPWILGFSNTTLPAGAAGVEGAAADFSLVAGPAATLGAAAWDAWIVGAVVALVALLTIARVALFEDHVEIVLGAWIFAAPWVLGFYRWWPGAAWDHWLSGLVVFLVACWALPSVRNPR